MEERQPWFARLPADQRAGVLLVTQTGVANFVAWLGERGETIRLTAEAFRIAPRDLARRLSLRQTVDLVRIATEVFERHLPPLAADEAERRALVEGVLRFGREIAFAAATVYAGAAETRGAWDARLEALVVDAVVRGPHVDGGADDALVSRAVGAGLGPGRRGARGGRQPGPGRTGRAARRAARLDARRAGRSVLVGVQGSRLIVLVSEPAAGPGRAGAGGHRRASSTRSGRARSSSGPPAADLAAAHVSARDALSGLRAAPRLAGRAPPGRRRRPAARAGAGRRPGAHGGCVGRSSARCEAAGGELLHTAGLLPGRRRRAGGVRPRRCSCTRTPCATGCAGWPSSPGRSPTDPRDALVLRIAPSSPARLGAESAARSSRPDDAETLATADVTGTSPMGRDVGGNLQTAAGGVGAFRYPPAPPRGVVWWP